MYIWQDLRTLINAIGLMQVLLGKKVTTSDGVTLGLAADLKLGLVRRVRSEHDRRENHLSLTPLGRERLARAIEVGNALKEHLCSAFSEEEVQEAMRLMTKLRVQILKEMGREPIQQEIDHQNRQRVIELLREPLRG